MVYKQNLHKIILISHFDSDYQNVFKEEKYFTITLFKDLHVIATRTSQHKRVTLPELVGNFYFVSLILFSSLYYNFFELQVLDIRTYSIAFKDTILSFILCYSFTFFHN